MGARGSSSFLQFASFVSLLAACSGNTPADSATVAEADTASNLVGYWTFDALTVTGTAASDSSGAGNSAILSG